MTKIFNSVSNSTSNFVNSSKTSINDGFLYVKTKIHDLTSNTGNTLLNFISKINKFILDNFGALLFGICSLYAYKAAFIRFTISTIVTLVLIDKNKQPQKEVLSANKIALNILGVLGIIFDKVLIIPIFAFSPILSGYAVATTVYNLYRHLNLIKTEEKIN